MAGPKNVPEMMHIHLRPKLPRKIVEPRVLEKIVYLPQINSCFQVMM